MGSIEDLLQFTTDTEEDSSVSTVSTQDTAIRVAEDITIQFKFWLKPTSSNRTLDNR